MLFEELKIHLLPGLVVVFAVLMYTHSLYAVGHRAAGEKMSRIDCGRRSQVQERCCHVTTDPLTATRPAQTSAQCRIRGLVSKGRMDEETAVRRLPSSLGLGEENLKGIFPD